MKICKIFIKAVILSCLVVSCVLADLANSTNYSNIKFLINSDLVKNVGYDNYDSETNGEGLAIKSLIHDGDVVFDVGANVGNWTNNVLSNHKNVCICAFEPIPNLVESMKKRFKDKDDVSVYELAIFSEQKRFSFDYYENNSVLSGIYHQSWVKPWSGHEPQKIEVEATTLDIFCSDKKFDHINFLKIDTEGSELNVLLGASDLLKKNAIDVIQFEYTFTYPDAKITLKQVYDLLTNFGYSVFREYSGGLIYIPSWDNSLEVYKYSNYIAIANFGNIENVEIKEYDPLLVIVIMIKNEASVIKQTLQPYVDAGLNSFLVLDTGSTDDTVLVTKKFFEENHVNRAVIKQEPFVDFATSRSRALQLAQESFPNACFMLMPDAEWYMNNVKSLVKFCELNKYGAEASYLVHIICGQLDYYVRRLIRCHTNTYFVGSVHEELNNISLKKVSTDCFFDWRPSTYGQEKSQKRWTRDCAILLKEYEKDPNNARTVFYLAQTYACLGDLKNACFWYERRTKMLGWDEENFIAYYKLAQVYEALGEWDKALAAYFKALSLRPCRAEPLVRLAQHYLDTGDKELCFLFAQRAVELPYPSSDVLFIEKEMYDYTRYDLLGASAWYVGQFNLGEKAVLNAINAHPNERRLYKNLECYVNYAH